MKNGYFYTDGEFLVRVDDPDALDVRAEATEVVVYRKDVRSGSGFSLENWTHADLLRRHRSEFGE